MSIYQCEKCGCAENTALGFHWSRNDERFRKKLGEDFGKKLCSACTPESIDPDYGKWHGQFERVFYPLGTMETDSNGNLAKKK